MKSIKLSNYYEIINPNYKYLKLTPNNGVRNYNSDEIASYVNSMYLDLSKRIYKMDNKFFIKSKCKLSYYIHITRADVQFFFIVPEYHISMVKQRLNNIWNNKITIEETSNIPVFSNAASKNQMVYKNIDSLSLDSDKKNNNLLASNFTIIDSMVDDDAVGILYNFIPMSNRQKKVWFTHYEEDMQKYKDNKPLEKISLDTKDLLKRVAMFLVEGLNSIIKDIQESIGGKRHDVAILNDISNVIVDKKQLSNSTLKKKNDCIVRTQIVTLAESKDITQQNKLLDSINNSFDVVRKDNQLISKTIKNDFKIEDYDFGIDTIRCSDREISNFVSLPGREILNQYKSISKIEVNETKVPNELQKGYISLGINQYKNTNQKAFFSDDKSLSNLPIAILGGSRSGKSTYSENLCKNIIDRGGGLILIDFIKNTEFADTIKSITPTDKLIDLDLSDPNKLQSFSYNEIEVCDNMSSIEIVKKANMQIQQVMALVDSINEDGSPLTGKMRRYLLSAGKVIFTKSKTSLKDVIKCLQNYNYRMSCIGSLSPEVKTLLEDNIDTLLELNDYDKKTSEIVGTKDSKIEGILDRINLLKESINLDIMFNLSPENNINFVDAMNKGKVILIRLREDEFFDKLSKNILVTFFITKIWLASQIRGKNKDITRCTVLIDEIFQTPMAQKIIGKQLVQSAKFSLKYVFTLHYLNQLYPDVKEALKSANASYMLISGCDKKAFKELEEEFNSLEYELEDLLNLKRYHSLNLVKTEKSYSAFITKLPPPII